MKYLWKFEQRQYSITEAECDSVIIMYNMTNEDSSNLHIYIYCILLKNPTQHAAIQE